MGGNIASMQPYTHLRPVHEMPARERLAEAVLIAEVVTLARKRARASLLGEMLGLRRGHSHKFGVGTGREVVDTHT